MDKFQQYGRLIESDTHQISDLDKREFIDVFLYSMKERQQLVSQTLNKVLVEKDSSAGSALVRFYDLVNNG